MKNLIDRYKKRRRDAGMGLVDAVVGIGLAALIIGGPILYFTTVNNTAAGNASTQSQNTAISEALDRAVANVQASDTIVYAGPNELVTRSTEVEEGKPDVPVVTRWVLNGTALYRQTWSGAGTGPTEAAAYNRTTPVTNTSVTGTVIQDLKLDYDLFSYTDKDGTNIDVKAPKDALTETGRTNPADGKRTYDIALVNLAIKAGTTANGGKTGVVESKTSAAPRSVSGKATGLDGTAPMCPAVSVSTNADGKPVITWSTLSGYTSYQVTRNGTEVAVVTAAATDTQKSWTDAAVTAGPAEVVQYRVYARNADGTTASIACMPKVWSPQLAAPEFQNSGVFPRADQAHEWTDGADGALALKKPRIVLKWGAVAGATSYELKYRQLDPVTGSPLTPGFSAVATALPAGTTTFTWDEGGWAASYEWFIKANAGVGQGQSAESAHIKTLTHPPAPQNVVIKAEYGTGSARQTTGNNVITWDAVKTATGYDIWRYVSGSTGPVTRIGQVGPGTRSYTDPQPYGTTHTYYVAAINDGPRGNISGKASSANPEAGVTTATGTMPTVAYREPAGGSPVITTASFKGMQTLAIQRVADTDPINPAPPKVSQLQYPPIPDISEVSTAANQTRDLEGVNRVVWAPTLSATSYLPARSTVMDSKITCLAGDCQKGSGGTTATSLTDPAAKGTQFDYYVKAVNPTGLSVDFSAKVRLTQRPATPPLDVTRQPDLSSSGATFTTTANADTGNDGANRFCTSETCKYELSRNGTPVSTLSQPAAGSGSTVTWSTPSNPEGETITFTARSKNEAVTNGGFSDPRSATVNTYPGDFGVNQWLGDRFGNGRERFMASLTSTDVAGSSTGISTPGQTSVAWGTSAGASSMAVNRVALDGERTSTDPSLGLPSSGQVNWNFGGGSDIFSAWAAPGATYKHTVTATAPNGLTRTKDPGVMRTPADVPHHAIVQITCSNNTYSNQQSALWDFPNHYVGARMIDMYKHPLSGSWGGTSIWGLQSSKGGGLYMSNALWLNPWDGNRTVNAGPGNPYYYGVTSGFDIQNASGNGGPPSARIRLGLSAYATFNSGCGPAGGTWDALSEPTYPCYGYIPGQPCKAVNNQNRPQWTSK